MPQPLSSALTTSAVVALGVRPDSGGGANAGTADQPWPVDLSAHLRRADATGRAGEVTEIPLVDHRSTRSLLLVGVGAGRLPDLRVAAAAAARRAQGQRRLAVDLGQRSQAEIYAVAEAAGLAAYRFGSAAGPRPVRRVDLHVPDAGSLGVAADVIERAATTVAAVHLARDLTNTPSNRKSPRWLTRRAEQAARSAGLGVTVLDAHQLRRRGFGGLLAVGAGSANPPTLVRLEYRPPPRSRGRGRVPRSPRHVVLVGKGITFDSGGLSLKPPEAMVTMKTDMAGAAAVLAVMTALPALRSPVRVTGLLAVAENLPSGSAVRPGDVLTTYDGTTVEVLNTDAEGRLVLADALGFATMSNPAPDAVVDLATLTGAATIALGRGPSALYSDDEALADELLSAAGSAGEQVWRMPLVDEYRITLESPVADLSHIGRDPKVSGGSIVAALFLQAFTHGVPWAHLDIAGPARADADGDEISKGGTGYGVRLLLDWLLPPEAREER